MKRADNWTTPPWVFGPLNDEFQFTVDAAAEHWNAKLPRYWTRAEDGLSQKWEHERVWCNPPYGLHLPRWIGKAIDSDALSVLLVPARIESHWFHAALAAGAEIRFVRGRVHFGAPPGVKISDRGSRPVWASIVLIFLPHLYRANHLPDGISVMDGREPRLREDYAMSFDEV